MGSHIFKNTESKVRVLHSELTNVSIHFKMTQLKEFLR